jgi:hypothetical protein
VVEPAIQEVAPADIGETALLVAVLFWFQEGATDV